MKRELKAIQEFENYINLGSNEYYIIMLLNDPSNRTLTIANGLIQTYKENLDKLTRQYNSCKTVIERTNELSPLQPERPSATHKKILAEFDQFGQEIANCTKTLHELQVKQDQVTRTLAQNNGPLSGR